MSDKLQRLKAILNDVSDLDMTANLLEWDQSTYMPPGGGEARADHLATVRRLQHERLTGDEVGRLLEDIAQEGGLGEEDSDDACIVRVVKEDYERRRKVPASLVAELARHVSLAHGIWVRSRAESDFSLFQPALETMVELKRRQAEALGPSGCLYDALLHEFEPFMKTAQVKAVFDGLKVEIVPLVKAVGGAGDSVSDAVLRQRFDVGAQREFVVAVVRRLGFDFDRGRLDLTVHPFCTNMSPGDVRLTTRFDPEFLGTALFGTIHESGHGMYEQGIPPALRRTTLGTGASLGFHESQSRLWENILGRSRGFWRHFYPELQAAFPQLAPVGLETFYRAINIVRPSFIRVEADELTYSLHIMLRFELEQDLLDGRVRVADAPAAWNSKMQEYLGLTPPNDALGVLQDVHWSIGYIGYFPTYALGNILSVQLYEKAILDAPGIPAAVERGEFSPLLAWLREKIHRHGRKYPPAELIRRVTGGPLDSGPYVRYLKTKFGEIYSRPARSISSASGRGRSRPRSQ
jgi:carboxypeptidase Taq